jgi:hypothetical protein
MPVSRSIFLFSSRMVLRLEISMWIEAFPCLISIVVVVAVLADVDETFPLCRRPIGLNPSSADETLLAIALDDVNDVVTFPRPEDLFVMIAFFAAVDALGVDDIIIIIIFVVVVVNMCVR